MPSDHWREAKNILDAPLTECLPITGEPRPKDLGLWMILTLAKLKNSQTLRTQIKALGVFWCIYSHILQLSRPFKRKSIGRSKIVPQRFLSKEMDALQKNLQISVFDDTVISNVEHLADELEAWSSFVADSNVVFALMFNKAAALAMAFEIEVGFKVGLTIVPIVEVDHVGIARGEFLPWLDVAGGVETHAPIVESIPHIGSARVIKSWNGGVQSKSASVGGQVGIGLDNAQQPLLVIVGIDSFVSHVLIMECPNATASWIVQADIVTKEGIVIGLTTVSAIIVKAGGGIDIAAVQQGKLDHNNCVAWQEAIGKCRKSTGIIALDGKASIDALFNFGVFLVGGTSCWDA